MSDDDDDGIITLNINPTHIKLQTCLMRRFKRME